jgi:excisionase family DNA binding protein
LTPLMRRARAAELLDISESTIRRWAADGRLEERRIGPHTVRITAASVRALLGEADGQQNPDREAEAA